MRFYENRVLDACFMKDEFWIRFASLKNKKYNGFRIINTNKKSLRFSERLKKVKTTQILNYNFKRLRSIKNIDYGKESTSKA